MTVPGSRDEFVELVRKSGVVDQSRFDDYLHSQPISKGADDPRQLTGLLVRDGILTHFQAEQLLAGKWRNFKIGGYRILERIGTGGMGSVYLCQHVSMRRRVALKVLSAAKANNPATLERFFREARAVAALDHPNIVRAYDIDCQGKVHFFVMEYVEGSSLQEIVMLHGRLDITRAAHYIQQAAIGLRHAHESAGLVHRDIKPGNILLDRNGVVKILDLGLARFFHDTDDNITEKYDEIVLGTADYVSPEQALDSHNADIRADIYSLGCTFYFCLTGSTPFTEGTVAQKLTWHQNKKPIAATTLRPEIPVEMAAVLDKMMAKSPAQRYQCPAEVVAALAPFTRKPIPPPPDCEMPRHCHVAMDAEKPDPELLQPPEPAAPSRASDNSSRNWLAHAGTNRMFGAAVGLILLLILVFILILVSRW